MEINNPAYKEHIAPPVKNQYWEGYHSAVNRLRKGVPLYEVVNSYAGPSHRDEGIRDACRDWQLGLVPRPLNMRFMWSMLAFIVAGGLWFIYWAIMHA